MLESVSDLVSLTVMICAVLIGLFYLYKLSNLHRSIELKRKEDLYYKIYDEIGDDEDEEEEDAHLPDKD